MNKPTLGQRYLSNPSSIAQKSSAMQVLGTVKQPAAPVRGTMAQQQSAAQIAPPKAAPKRLKPISLGGGSVGPGAPQSTPPTITVPSDPSGSASTDMYLPEDDQRFSPAPSKYSMVLPADLPDEDAPDEDAAPKYTARAPSMARSAAPAHAAAMSVAAVQEKLSLWDRILALFGLSRKKSGTASMGAERDRATEVAALVRRARAGDQNAMAMIAMVRRSADKGSMVAQVTSQMIRDYIAKNPVPGARMGLETTTADPLYAKAVALSHGPLLSNARIANMTDALDGRSRELFFQGMKWASSEAAPKRGAPPYEAGRIVGMARALQAVRMPSSPVSKQNRVAGAEMGEE